VRRALLLTPSGLALARLCLLVADKRWWADTPLIVAGTAPRPFVFRQLAPLAIRALMALGLTLEAAAVVVLVVSTVGFVWALYALGRELLSEPAAWWLALLAPLGLLPFVVGLYVYDVPALALFTLGLALLARREWRWYLALFPLGVLGRETFALLAVVFAFAAWRALRPRPFYAALAWQLGTVLLVKLSLAWLFRANPGALYESHLIRHYSYLKWEPLPNLAALALLTALTLGVLRAQRGWPPFLQGVALLLPAFFFAYLLFGYPGEWRAVVEVYPALLIVGARAWPRRALKPIESPAALG